MKFNEILNDYIKKLDCTAKELADAAEVSQVVISRYRNGERVPAYDSEQVKKIAYGIHILAVGKEYQEQEWSENEIYACLQESLSEKKDDFDTIIKNINLIITTMKVNISELANELNYDASYISRIRYGQRRPASMDEFVGKFCNYIANNYSDEESKEKISEILSIDVKLFANQEEYSQLLRKWIKAVSLEQNAFVDKFLKQLDDFNLNDYIKAIHFDELKVPTVPFQFGKTSKKYYGLEEIKQANLDFLKTTVLSKSMEPLYMYDDTPMADLARETDFPKKWMFGLAMALKKGLHINIIHNLNRPFEEMMLGLEAWIPLYMTGQVTPYYYKRVHNEVFKHFLNVSGVAALEGECIEGFHEDVRYYLTRNKEEVDYYRKRFTNMLSKADSLMDIYRKENKEEFTRFKAEMARYEGVRQERLASLPIYTFTNELLESILEHNHISDANKKEILDYYERSKKEIKQFLGHSEIKAFAPMISKEEFVEHPMNVSLSGAFYEGNVQYTYEEYLEHIESTKCFAEDNDNYTLELVDKQEFRNIQIIIEEGKWALISKNMHPTIHFVIRHPMLLNAIENMIAPIVE